LSLHHGKKEELAEMAKKRNFRIRLAQKWKNTREVARRK